MRFSTTIVLLFGLPALGWSGYWYAGATAKEAVLKAWLEDRRAAGWVAEAEALEVGGFPYRFDSRIKGLELADPAAGWAWSAPAFEVLALAYKPTHVIAVWPERQVIATPDGEVEILAEQMRGSVEFDVGTDLVLDRLVIDMAGVRFNGEGWQSGAAKALVATRRAAEDRLHHDVSVEAREVLLTEAVRRLLDPGQVLPAAFETLLAQARVGFDAPLDRTAVEVAPPAITSFRLDRFQATWGELDLRAVGELAFRPDGTPEGQIDVKARNWAEMVTLAVNAGALSAEAAGRLTTALGVLSAMSGNRETLDVPLRFADGLTYLGPLPVGPAPRLRIGQRQ